MGIQTMASQGGGEGQQAQLQTLARQGSLYSLTLNEVQSQLGEPLHSMNLDELLRNILPAEGGDQPPVVVDLEIPFPQPPSGSGLRRQGSVTITRALSKKTVDEVWRDIQRCQEDKGASDELRVGSERELTLGEMTLEDFLVRAGEMVEGPEKKRNGNVGSRGGNDALVGAQGYPQGVHWLRQYHQVPSLQQQVLPPNQRPSQQQQRQVQQSAMSVYAPSRPVAQPLGVEVGSMLDAGYSDTQLTMSSPMMGALSDTQTPGRKRIASGDVTEKTVERRQKRMIKNRESAARSRARKQAYTNELENKVTRLEEENERLKKQKEMETILYSMPLPEPKFRLRRTSSAPF